MRKLITLLLFSAAMFFGPAVSSAQACPMCAEANKQDENRPKAYMYSILFMMAMPAVIFTGFGIGLYRLHKRSAKTDGDPSPDLLD